MSILEQAETSKYVELKVSIVGSDDQLVVGSVITASLSSGFTSSGFQFTRDNNDISGAIGNTYTITSADIDTNIRARTINIISDGLVVPAAQVVSAPLLVQGGLGRTSEGTARTVDISHLNVSSTATSWNVMGNNASITNAGALTIDDQAQAGNHVYDITATNSEGSTSLVESVSLSVDKTAVGMRTGLNLGFASYWNTTLKFTNLVRHVRNWKIEAYSTPNPSQWSQAYSGLLMTNLADIVQTVVAENIPAGSYRVRWAGVGELNTGAGFSSTKEYYVTINEGSTLTAKFRGASLTAFDVVHVDNIELYDNGMEWLPGYVSTLRRLNISCLRFMDATDTNGNILESFSDLPSETDLWFSSITPIPILAQLCNLLNANAWWCVPKRANDLCVQQSSIAWQGSLNTDLKVNVQDGNERWNYFSIFGDGTNWTLYQTNPRYNATVDDTGTYTHVAHGMSTGGKIRGFEHPDDYKNFKTADYSTVLGNECDVVVVDANTFTLERFSTQVGTSQSARSYVYIKMSDPETADKSINTNYTNRSEHVWDVLEATAGGLSRNRMKYTLGFQGANPAMAESRVNALSDTNRVDVISGGGYVTGNWWHVGADVSNGSVIPKIFIARKSVVSIGLYLATDTPTIADVVAGTGSIQTAVHAPASVSAANGVYQNLSAFTGLTPTTAYTLHYVLGDDRHLSVDFTPNVTVSVFKDEPFHVFADLLHVVVDRILARSKEAIDRTGKSYEFYEAGFHPDEEAPAEAEAWIMSFVASTELAAVFKNYMFGLASIGIKVSNFYRDASRNDPFGLWSATSTPDTDSRFLEYESSKGLYESDLYVPNEVRDYSLIVQPVSFPHSIFNVSSNMTFAGSPSDFKIIAGNGSDYYELDSVGNLSLTALAASLDFLAENVHTVVVLVKDINRYIGITITSNIGEIPTISISMLNLVTSIGGAIFTVSNTGVGDEVVLQVTNNEWPTMRLQSVLPDLQPGETITLKGSGRHNLTDAANYYKVRMFADAGIQSGGHALQNLGANEPFSITFENTTGSAYTNLEVGINGRSKLEDSSCFMQSFRYRISS